MKTQRALVRRLSGVTVLLLLAAGCQTLCDTSLPGYATILKVKGEARYCDLKHNAWRKLKGSEILEAGAVIQTEQAKGVFVDLDLGPYSWGSCPPPRGVGPVPNRDKQAERAMQVCPVTPEKPKANVVRLWENSLLRVERLPGAGKCEAITKPQLRLAFGHMMMVGDLRELGPGAAVTVGFTNGTVRMQRGGFELRASGELNVRQGAVTITLNDKHLTKEVTAGHGFDPKHGELFELPPPYPHY